jgi:hypothetical protein
MENRHHERERESFAVITDEEKACISVCVYKGFTRLCVVDDKVVSEQNYS